jgi:hypothetical protein
MMVWVDGPQNGGWGDVYLVNYEGFRVDDRALFSARQEPFIRNVKVKREGWVLMRPWRDQPAPPFSLARFLATNRAYTSEAEAREAMDYYSVEPGTKPVYLTWEE